MNGCTHPTVGSCYYAIQHDPRRPNTENFMVKLGGFVERRKNEGGFRENFMGYIWFPKKEEEERKVFFEEVIYLFILRPAMEKSYQGFSSSSSLEVINPFNLRPAMEKAYQGFPSFLPSP